MGSVIGYLLYTLKTLPIILRLRLQITSTFEIFINVINMTYSYAHRAYRS